MTAAPDPRAVRPDGRNHALAALALDLVAVAAASPHGRPGLARARAAHLYLLALHH